jgi:hypothetical protein
MVIGCASFPGRSSFMFIALAFVVPAATIALTSMGPNFS